MAWHDPHRAADIMRASLAMVLHGGVFLPSQEVICPKPPLSDGVSQSSMAVGGFVCTDMPPGRLCCR